MHQPRNIPYGQRRILIDIHRCDSSVCVASNESMTMHKGGEYFKQTISCDMDGRDTAGNSV